MKIVADKNMPLLAETFGRHGEIQLLDGRHICNADLADADVLLVRSVTRVDESLLRGTGIRFVGSATIGIDHLDTTWLNTNNIIWAHAPGCNANAASQYALAMMWLACEHLNRDFRQQTVGIIGRGNVGQRLEHLLKILNIPVMSCDPPLQDAGEPQLVSMDEACANSIISMHVPLTSGGKYPTINLFDSRQLEALRSNTLLVNTSRGAVIEKAGLLAQIYSGRLQAALDVWPDEPFIDPEMLDAVTIATPHVAGYSLEGKQAGTEMIYAVFCKRFSLRSPGGQVPGIETVTLDFPSETPGDQALRRSIQSSSQVERDDTALRQQPPFKTGDKRVHIDSLRAAYPDRYEFKSHLVRGLSDADAQLMNQLGFKTG
jgi:erythronate-4-phosphate dehydrogenase